MAKRSVAPKKEKTNKEDQFVFPIENFKVSDEVLEQGEYTLSYFRQFPYAFCEEYLKIKLYDYQKIIIYEMMHKYNFIWIACRNLAKTFMSALYICTRCILYPKTKVIVCASERQQAVETITKIKDLMKNSPMLREEISDISDSVNTPKCLFWNGSTVNIATMSEGSRHFRANLILVDEFIMADPTILSSVIEAFLGDPRRPLFLNDSKYDTPEYEYLKEKDTSMYCSSAGRKGTWAYDMFEDYFNKMINGDDDYFVCDLPYQTAVSVGLRSLAFYTKQRTSKIMTEEKFKAEYEGIWITDNENGYFKYDSLENCRTIKKAVYTNTLNEYIRNNNKSFTKSFKRPENAIRICGGDLASVGSRKNDASAFGVMQLTPKTETIITSDENGTEKKIQLQYYDRELIYLETLEGVLMKDQANRLKQLYKEYDCQYMCIDAMNVGSVFVQMMGEPSINVETGEDYPAFMCCNKPEYAEMCNYQNAEKTLYCINASAQSNHDMFTSLQAVIGKKRLKLLMNENTAKDYLRVIHREYDREVPSHIKEELIKPYINTALFVQEAVALEKKIQDNGLIKLKEPSGGRKDRVSCVLYLNSIADELESKLKQPEFEWSEENDLDEWYVPLY